MSGNDTFRWRKTSEEVPHYELFGHSPEVIGIDKEGCRHIYQYVRGEWDCIEQDNYGVTSPTMWHYLPARPKVKDNG